MPLEKTEKVIEGDAEIYVSAERKSAITKKARVFYNPAMKLNRDISVLALAEFQKLTKRKLKVADCLSASGIRGIRYALEAPEISEAILCDLNPSAIELIQKNAAHNKLGITNVELTKSAKLTTSAKAITKTGLPDSAPKIIIEHKDACAMLSEHKYEIDFVDIDPFGSPIQFLDSAARAVSNKGMLAVTATDTAPLCGTYKRACIRKYAAAPLRCAIQHEIGIRILIANIARECSKYDKGFEAFLSVSDLHYFRVFGKIKKTKSAAEENIKNIGYLNYCKNCGASELAKNPCAVLCRKCSKKVSVAGPLWIGKIFEPDFCWGVWEQYAKKSALEPKTSNAAQKKSDTRLEKILALIRQESEINALWYDIGFLSSVLKTNPPKIERVMEKLRDGGFNASRTHFSPTGIRTDAEIGDIKKAFESIGISV